MDALLCADKAQPKAAAQELLTQVAARVPRGRTWLLKTLAASEVPCSYTAPPLTAVSCTLGLAPADTPLATTHVSDSLSSSYQDDTASYLFSGRLLIWIGRTSKVAWARHAGFQLRAHVIAAV